MTTKPKHGDCHRRARRHWIGPPDVGHGAAVAIFFAAGSKGIERGMFGSARAAALRAREGTRAMQSKQALLICLVIALSVLAIDGLDRRYEIRSNADARAKVQEMIRLMDKESHGQVSNSLFMQFMNKEFDRIDADRSGSLTAEEMSHSILFRERNAQPAAAGK
jgi:hypothetical protein